MKLRSGTKSSRGACQPPASKSPRIERRRPRRDASKLTEGNLRKLTQAFGMPRRKTTTGSSSSRTTTTDKNFPSRLIANNVNFDRLNKAPCDIDEIKAFLERPRQSPSPDTDDHTYYVDTLDRAANEASMRHNAWPLLSKPAGKSGVSGYGTRVGYEWTECDNSFTDNGLSNPRPDITESLEWKSYPSAAVGRLGASLAPTAYNQALPHIAIEYRGPNGALDQAKHQSAYTGAVITEACRQIAEHMAKPLDEYYRRTQALTLTSNGTRVEVFANHATKGQVDPTYYHHHVASLTTDTPDHFKTAYKYVRNAQDWARERAVQTRAELSAYHEGGWIWSSEHSRYYRIANGQTDWAPPPDVLTPPTSSSSSSSKRRRTSKPPVKKR